MEALRRRRTPRDCRNESGERSCQPPHPYGRNRLSLRTVPDSHRGTNPDSTDGSDAITARVREAPAIFQRVEANWVFRARQTWFGAQSHRTRVRSLGTLARIRRGGGGSV